MDVLLCTSPLLLGSPLVFLISEVRKRTVLRLAALAIVGGCYLMLVFEVVPAIIAGAVMVVADRPTRDFVINRDQTLAGIRFPKGSKISTQISKGQLSPAVLSEDIEINGIPAEKGMPVIFGPDGNLSLTTGRVWTYRGIPVPAGSIIFLSASGVYETVISQPSAEVSSVEDVTVHGVATLKFNGDRLTSLYGHYIWHGEHYQSYRVDVDGQIQRQRESGS
jgi:hypothetical protein